MTPTQNEALVKVITRFLVACIFGSALEVWELVVVPATTPPSNILWWLASIFDILMVAAAVGLWRQRPWGFYVFYVLVPYSLAVLSVVVIPTPFLRVGLWGAVLLDAVAVSLAVFAHVAMIRGRQGVGVIWRSRQSPAA